MKRKHILVTVFSVVAFTVGCKPTSTEPTAEPSTSQLEELKKETKEAAAATRDYAYAQKTEFVETMRTEIAALNKEMDELGAKIESSSSAAKEEAKAKLQALREKTAELNAKLDSVNNASESTWEEVKTSFKNGYAEFKSSLNEARQWLSDKIAPTPAQ